MEYASYPESPMSPETAETTIPATEAPVIKTQVIKSTSKVLEPLRCVVPAGMALPQWVQKRAEEGTIAAHSGHDLCKPPRRSDNIHKIKKMTAAMENMQQITILATKSGTHDENIIQFSF
jgi:hypothetical protein